MAYKFCFQIKGQHKGDSYMYDDYDTLLAIFHGIKLSGGIINKIPIVKLNELDKIQVIETSYDYEEDGKYYIRNPKSDNKQDDFDISDVDELKPFENDITTKFNIDTQAYYDKARLEYDNNKGELKYLGKSVFTFKKDSNKKIFIELMISKRVGENVSFNEIYGKLDKTYVGGTLEAKQDKVIRNLIDNFNKFLYPKIKLEKTFWLQKNGQDRHVHRII